MIPICRDPKRFVAALNKERALHAARGVLSVNLHHLKLQGTSSSANLKAGTSFSNPRYFSTAPEPISKPSIVISPHVNVEQPYVEATKDSMPLTGPRSLQWFTGKAPKVGQCPGMSADGYLYSLPQLSFANNCFTRKHLQDYFDNTWTLTEVLLSSLQSEEAFMRSPYHDLRHPMIFYYGHPAALYVNKLRVAGLLKDPINPYFESVFETGVDEMSWDDLSKNKMPWPSVAEVHNYRKIVYNTTTKIIQNLTDAQLNSVDKNSPIWSLLMGFEHERIHLETSSFLINELPVQYVRRPECFPSYHPSLPSRDEEILDPVAGVHYPVNEMIPVERQHITIGKPESFPSYGWDNEYGHREFTVPAFQASKYKISNGEYLEFVKDGGYSRVELWNEVGWKWRSFRNVKWPTFWSRKGPQGHHQYDLRILFDVIPMPWDWPVVINFHEATAFANWKSLKTSKSFRILTELEHRAIRDKHLQGAEGNDLKNDMVLNHAGDDMATKEGYNINLAYSSMSPVNALAPNSKGFHDVFGNAWEWTEDYFAPLPGFTVHPFYEDFSTPCFDGLHHVIQGGSYMSTGNEASVHARFHFRPHFYQHASCRLVEQVDTTVKDLFTSDTDAPGPYVGSYPFRQSTEKVLEKNKTASRMSPEDYDHIINPNVLLSKHFGALSFAPTWGMEGFFNTIRGNIRFSDASAKSLATAKVIEIGCGAGGLSFAFAKECASVIGIDHSMDSISIAKQMHAEGKLSYSLANEGNTLTKQLATRPNVEGKIDFRCADPMCIPAEMNGFDVVVLNDVLDKISSPNAVLGRLGGVRGLVSPGGCLVAVSAYQWSENRTPKSLWLGGQESTTKSSEEELIARMAQEDFVAYQRMQVPLLWHQNAKDVKGKVYNVTFFTRK